MIMYNRDLVLPIDVKYNWNKNGNNYGDQELFNFATFDVVISSATKLRASIIDDVSGNIKKAQAKQKRYFDCRNLPKAEIHVDDTVLLFENQQAILLERWEVFTKVALSLCCYGYHS